MTEQQSSNEPGPGADPGAGPEPEPATCPWCAAVAGPGASRCGDCGAALAQRESIGDLRIPGLTAVNPALEDYAKRPMQLHGPSPSQGIAPALIVGALAGGPIGLMAIGGVAAVAGAEFLGTRIGGSGGQALEDLGKPSEVMLQALEQTDAAADSALAAGAIPSPVGDGAANPEPDAAAAENGMSIWRDLPDEKEAPGPG